MRSLQDEIKKAQQELACPICNRSFRLKDMNLRTIWPNSIIELSVVCSRGHFPIILIVPIALKESAKAGRIKRKELINIHHQINKLKKSLTTIK